MSDAAQNDAANVAMKSKADAPAAVVTGSSDAEAMALAAGVMETIVQLAVSDVEGVTGLGVAKSRRKLFGGKAQRPPIEVTMEDDGSAVVAVHLSVRYGQVLPDVAAAVRQAVVEALMTQVGVKAKRIDIFVDGISFE